MQRGLWTASWAAIALVGVLAWPSSGSDLSKFLRAVFEDQNGRPPTGTEVHYYSSVSRTDGPLESLARMVSSNDYFYGQCQQRSDLYVTRLYEIFLHREPTFEEQRYWVSRVPGGGSDARLAFVRQFCQANNLVDYVPTVTGMAPLPSRPAGTRSELARQLETKASQLNSLVQNELGGTYLGRDLTRQAVVLASASTQYRETVESPDSTSQQVAIASNNVARALQELQATFRSVPGASAACQSVLWEVSQLEAAAELSAKATVASPNAASAVEAEAGQLLSLLRQFTSVLSRYQQQGAFYVNLARDVDALAVQAESLQLLARQGAGDRDVKRITTSLLTQGRDVARQMNQTDIRLQQSWWNIQHELDQLALAAGCAGDLYVATDHPVILNHPAWSGFPVQPSPGYQASADNRQIINYADHLLAQLDNYVLSLRPVAARNGDAGVMLNQTLNLRNAVLVLRQQAAAGAWGTQLQSASRESVRLYAAAGPSFLKMVGQDPSLNSPVWAQIGELTYKIDRELSGARY
jgi:hypothetical protein